MVGLSLAVVPVVWVEVDLQVATFSRGPETGSVLIRMCTFAVQRCLDWLCYCLGVIVLFPGVVATRTLAGDWNATSAKPLSQRGLEVVLHFL